MAVPIEVEGKARGLLLVGDKESRRGVGPFRDADRRTLDLFANQAAIALENARLHRQALEKERLEREMELAAEIQRQILPTGAPWLPGFELVGWNRPAPAGRRRLLRLPQAGRRPPGSSGRRRLGQGNAGGAHGVDAALGAAPAARRRRGRPELLARLNEHIVRSSAPEQVHHPAPRRARARDRPVALRSTPATTRASWCGRRGRSSISAPAACRWGFSPAPATGSQTLRR